MSTARILTQDLQGKGGNSARNTQLFASGGGEIDSREPINCSPQRRRLADNVNPSNRKYPREWNEKTVVSFEIAVVSQVATPQPRAFVRRHGRWSEEMTAGTTAAEPGGFAGP